MDDLIGAIERMHAGLADVLECHAGAAGGAFADVLNGMGRQSVRRSYHGAR